MLRIAVFLGVRAIAAATVFTATVFTAAYQCRADDPADDLDSASQEISSGVSTEEPAETESTASELLQPASFQVQGDPSSHGYVYLDSSGQLPPEPKPFPAGAEHSVLLSKTSGENPESEVRTAGEKAAALDVTSEEDLVARAVQLAKKADTVDDFTRVIRYCQKVAQLRPNREPSEFVVQLAAWAANRRGELAVAEGDETVALASFQQAVDIDGGCWQAIHNRGVSLAIQGDHAKALSDFTRAIDLNHDFAPAYRNRGELRITLGLVDAAIDDYTKAIQLTPDDAELYRIRGHAEHRRGRFVAAVGDFNEAIKKSPKSAPAYTDRGNVYAELGYYRQSLMDFRQALRADDRYPWAYRSVAWVLATCPDRQYRRPEKALVAAQRVLTLTKGVDPLDLDVMAAAQASAGQFAAAVATEKRALESAGTSPLSGEFRARLVLYQQRKNFISTPRDRHEPDVQLSAWTDAPPAAAAPKPGAPNQGGSDASRPKKPRSDASRPKKPSHPKKLGTPQKAGTRTHSGGRFQGRRAEPHSPPRTNPIGNRNNGKMG